MLVYWRIGGEGGVFLMWADFSVQQKMPNVFEILGLVGLRARVLTITYVNHKHVCFSSHELNVFFGLTKPTTHPRSGHYIED